MIVAILPSIWVRPSGRAHIFFNRRLYGNRTFLLSYCILLYRTFLYSVAAVLYSDSYTFFGHEGGACFMNRPLVLSPSFFGLPTIYEIPNI